MITGYVYSSNRLFCYECVVLWVEMLGCWDCAVYPCINADPPALHSLVHSENCSLRRTDFDVAINQFLAAYNHHCDAIRRPYPQCPWGDTKMKNEEETQFKLTNSSYISIQGPKGAGITRLTRR